MKFFWFACFLVGLSFTSHAQILKGTVQDQNGEPIPFAKVWVKSTSFGTVANGKGEYSIEFSDTGTYLMAFSFTSFEPLEQEIAVQRGENFYVATLSSTIQELGEVTVEATNRKKRGKEFMKQVIDKRSSFLDSSGYFTCETYCFTSLDKRTENLADSIPDTMAVNMKTMNITEWFGQSYYQANSRYKDQILGYRDYTEKAQNTASVTVTFSDPELGEQGSIEVNPYVLINGLEDADINIFKNSINAPLISQRPLISPLAYNALLYYNFYMEGSFFEGTEHIAEIRVEPIFVEEGLFSGTLFININTLEPMSYELGVNKGAMHYFKEMRLVTKYESIDGKPVPVKREFIYMVKEGKTLIHGNILVAHKNYEFDYDSGARGFWTETRSYNPDAFDKDSTFWSTKRPFQLDSGAKEFIRIQDSIRMYESSEEYLKLADSTYNTLSVWDFLFNGVGFRNTFKKQEIRFIPLIEQVFPFGVGGYRHEIGGSYKKEFSNAKAIDVRANINYGFRNTDLKARLGFGFTYNPLRFSRLFIEAGDMYDFVNSYESIQGTLGPANRVRNQKIMVEHQFEVLNGLYLSTSALFSVRRSIDNISYPEWVNVFGTFSDPTPFETYNIFMTEVEIAYYFQQKYMIKGGKKFIVSNRWPRFSLLYKKGYPKIFGGQSDFDFLEFRVDDRLDFKGWGQAEFKFTAGSFLRKENLRIIENKYFRTSDSFFFSNPVNSMQMLDTALNTSNSYLQTNFIHHFNGCFLNKIWLINKLGLEETIGGGLLVVPESKFQQVEFYVGLERMLRIKKQIFKLGVYAVASDNNFDKASIRYKIGINFYDSFMRKWDY